MAAKIYTVCKYEKINKNSQKSENFPVSGCFCLFSVEEFSLNLQSWLVIIKSSAGEFLTKLFYVCTCEFHKEVYAPWRQDIQSDRLLK